MSAAYYTRRPGLSGSPYPQSQNGSGERNANQGQGPAPYGYPPQQRMQHFSQPQNSVPSQPANPAHVDPNNNPEGDEGWKSKVVLPPKDNRVKTE
ncbi:DEAD (Asp-Glu-Ala-Asp) box polypeptide DDX6, partial [Toxoplasma gondii FOU]